MEVVGRTCTADVEQVPHAAAHLIDGADYRGIVEGERLCAQQRFQVVRHGHRQRPPAVDARRQQRVGAKAVGPVVGPAGLAADEKPWHVGHLVEVGPQPTHREVCTGPDAHGHLSWILAGRLVVHVQQVAVALIDHVDTEAGDRVAHVEVDTVV